MHLFLEIPFHIQLKTKTNTYPLLMDICDFFYLNDSAPTKTFKKGINGVPASHLDVTKRLPLHPIASSDAIRKPSPKSSSLPNSAKRVEAEKSDSNGVGIFRH
ncbi:hypothetical protein [Pseudomonas mucidolens]|uniref:hypothetical protein n=1 Tax=Pseudomonas mucidolens TaxID=46679 RepID=UPI001032EFBD|nr:hypothetical protein [Pseudomonas mucidolens]